MLEGGWPPSHGKDFFQFWPPNGSIWCILLHTKNYNMKFDPPHPTHFSSGTRRDRSPLHPAAIMAMNATVCSLPLAMAADACA